MAVAGEAFFGARIRALGPLAAAGDFAGGRGAVSEAAVEDAYVARLAEEAGGEPGFASAGTRATARPGASWRGSRPCCRAGTCC